MKMLKRSLAMMLALVMMFSAAPFTAFATESTDTPSTPTEAVVDAPASEPAPSEGTEETVPEETVVETTVDEETVPEETVVEEAPMMFSLAKSTQTVDASSFIKVFHLDCGRKYFTVDQIKELIDAISAKGFSHMELAIGNDGLRLLLDDMSITANGTTYNSDTIKSGIKSGNKNYSHSGEWTEAEMDTIIAYAKTKGIEIIPLVNNPGHMDSILAAMKACGIDGYYKSSSRTVDLENAEAVAFTQALVMKYAAYFANKGCNYFNIGADEYANDYHTSDSTGMGFGYLIDNNMYVNFITYVNTLVADICKLGMTPIAFNDGIYFRENTSFGTFDTRLVVAAWTGGWGGIKPASTTFLQNKGHQILNTNERWYYVLGRRYAVNRTYCYESALSNAKSESVTTVIDHKNGVTSMGAMQCVWCDVPSVNYETYKTNVMALINTLADNNPTYFTGPNEVTPDPEPEEPETVTKTDEATKVEIAAPGLTGLTVTVVDEVPTIEGAVEGKVLAWDITPATANGNYTGEATVSVPVPADWTNVRGGVLASANGEEVMGIEGKLENGIFTFTVPHFSTAVTYASDYDELVELSVGQTSETFTDNSGYYTTAEGLNTAVATAKLGGQQGSTSTATYKEVAVDYLHELLDENTTAKTATDYYVLADDGKYYPLYATRTSSTVSEWVSYTRYTYTWYYSTDNGTTFNDYGSQTADYYTYYKPNITLYEQSGAEAVDPYTTVAFTGVSVGETTATIGSTTYRIVVSKKAVSATVTIDATLTYNDTSANITVADDSVVSAEKKDGKLVITGLKEGNTTVTTDNAVYTVTVIPFDPDNAGTVPVFFWVTSHPITAQVNGADATSMEIRADDANVYSENGAKLSALVPTYGIDKQNTTAGTHALWHVRLQHEGAQQTTGGSDDKTAVGEHVDFIRYYGNKWQVKDLNGNWLDVAEDDQLTAYYLMKSALTDEVDSLVKDWGFQYKDGQKYWESFDERNYCALSGQVIYEDATMNPANDAALIDTTYFFNYWAKGQDGHTANRDIGFFLPQVNDDFEIYKITTMHGTCSVTAKSDKASAASVDYDTPAPNHADEVVVWQEGNGFPEIVGKDGDPALQWSKNKDAILIRIYVRAKVKDNTLKVVYIDEKFNDTLYSYNINVNAGVDFNNGIDPDPSAFSGNAERINVTGTGIENFKGVKQMFQTDLTKVPEAVGKYHSDLYEYTGSEIKDDGKTLYLYYNINTDTLSPNFVADFGLPIQFSLLDVVGTGEEKMVDSVTVNKKTKYGTLDYNDDTQIFTYTPTSILQGVDVLTINILFDDETAVSTTNVGVTPATTVFYEENFITFNSGWSGQATTNNVGPQTAEQLVDADSTEDSKKINKYGYDGAYAKAGVGASNGTKATATALGASATFTFTGRGVQVYANCGVSTGDVSVQVKNSAGKIVSLSLVDTHVGTGDGSATTGQTGNQYGLPVVSLFDFKTPAHDEYTVTITKIKDGTDPINIDGIRVINTLPNSAVFAKDLEDNPVFHELRDSVLTSLEIANNTSKDYGTLEEMAGQIYTKLTTEADTPVAVVTTAAGIYGGNASVKDLLVNGPKNELFLYPQQTLTFKVNTNREVQVGLKAPRTATQATIGSTNQDITTSVDMFYTVASRTDAAAAEQTFTITNSGNDILSVTALKVCDDPGFAFAPLTQDDIKGILVDAGYTDDVPSEPETEPTEPEVPETTKPSKPGKPNKPSKPTKPTEPEVEETKPSKPGNGNKPGNNKPGKPENTKPTEPQKPGKPGNNGNQKPGKEEKTYTLKITFVNLFGKKVGTATINTTKGMVSAYEIVGKAPAGRMAIWLIPVTLRANGNNSIVVPVI